MNNATDKILLTAPRKIKVNNAKQNWYKINEAEYLIYVIYIKVFDIRG
jgi:hypothetical protein